MKLISKPKKSKTVYRGYCVTYHYVQQYEEKDGDYSDARKTKKEAILQMIERCSETLEHLKELYEECEE